MILVYLEIKWRYLLAMFAPEETQRERIRQRMSQSGFDMEIFSWDHLFLAGGFMAGIRRLVFDEELYRTSDLDFFVHGVDHDSPEAVEISVRFIQSLGVRDCQIAGSVFTFHKNNKAVQLIFSGRNSDTPEDIALSFDMTHLMYGFDGEKFHDYSGDYAHTGVSQVACHVALCRYLKETKRGFQITYTDDDRACVCSRDLDDWYNNDCWCENFASHKLSYAINMRAEKLAEAEAPSQKLAHLERGELDLYHPSRRCLDSLYEREYFYWHLLRRLASGRGYHDEVPTSIARMYYWHGGSGSLYLAKKPIPGLNLYDIRELYIRETLVYECECPRGVNPVRFMAHELIEKPLEEMVERELWNEIFVYLHCREMTLDDWQFLCDMILNSETVPKHILEVLIQRMILEDVWQDLSLTCENNQTYIFVYRDVDKNANALVVTNGAVEKWDCAYNCYRVNREILPFVANVRSNYLSEYHYRSPHEMHEMREMAEMAGLAHTDLDYYLSSYNKMASEEVIHNFWFMMKSYNKKSARK